jgi:predicted RecB family nuclease
MLVYECPDLTICDFSNVTADQFARSDSNLGVHMFEAPYLGFKWRDKEPPGAASIEWYHRWVETWEADIRHRILHYNEDDCIAMKVLLDAVRGLSPK